MTLLFLISQKTKDSIIKQHLFKLDHIYKSFIQAGTTLPIFNDLSYCFESNKSYALMGTSGIGKSTLLHMLAGIENSTSGKITLNDIPTSISLLASSIGIILQQSCLINELTILENVMLKAVIKGDFDAEQKSRAIELLTLVGLESKANCFPASLSGGQQQKVAILRAIFYPPQFLLADEPTGNLDEASGKQIIELLLYCKKKYGMGLIISTHDIKIATHCDIIVQVVNQQLH